MVPRDQNQNIFDIELNEDEIFDLPFTNEDSPAFQNSFIGGISPSSIIAGELNEDIQQRAGTIYNTKTAFDNTQIGYILGIDPTDALAKFYIGNTTQYLNWTGSALNIAGALSASTIDIGGADATSFHVDTDGNMWLGAATFAASNAKISNAGAGTFNSITITGGSITATPIASIPTGTGTDISLIPFTHNIVFSVTDADTIAWTAGTVTMANATPARTFSISAGNTGNMAALTYIYLDTAAPTVFSTTTTYTTAVGANKVLIGVAQNQTVTASYVPMGGGGQSLIDGAQIGALSIVAGNIAASTITAGKLSVSQLSAIAADMGTITAGTVTGATIQTASSGNRFAMTSTAFQGIETGGSVVFEVLVSGVNAGDVIMGDDASGNYAIWDESASRFEVYANNVPQFAQGFFGGDGSDGALTITAGTTTQSAASGTLLVKNFTAISITGSGTYAITTPATAGTIIMLKSQGNVTLTSSAVCIDASGMGGAGGAGGSDAAGSAGTKGISILDELVNAGQGGAQAVTGGPSAAGTAGLQVTVNNSLYYTNSLIYFLQRFIRLACGSGGGGGGDGSPPGGGMPGGAGGTGGGVLEIECAGAWNFNKALGIDVSADAGVNGTSQTTDGGSGAGGGGSGGMFLGMYDTVTANTGTVNSAGGAGGTGGNGETAGGSGSDRSGGAGGGGAGGTGGAGGIGGAGANQTVGGAGAAGAGARAGGGGGAGGGSTAGAGSNFAGGAGGAAGASVNEFTVANTIYA